MVISGYSSDESDTPGILNTLAKHVIDTTPIIQPSNGQEQPINTFVRTKVISNIPIDETIRPKRGPEKDKQKRKRRKGKLDDEYIGPWASFENSEEEPEENELQVEVEEESENEIINEVISQSTSEYLSKFKYTTNFMDPEYDIAAVGECFVPKKIIHTYSGHTNGINKLEFFPLSGHLLLSCGNDETIRIWDIYRNKELIREYYGHSKPVKDVTFNSTGTQFLSCSFDKKVILWDTESGTILLQQKLEAIPTVVMFHPNDNEFLIGLRNNKIQHYLIQSIVDEKTQNKSTTTIKLSQTYDYHLGSVNTLMKIGDDRFLSSADDKSVRIWNYGVNIPIKTISHPTQYAISSAIVVPPKFDAIAMQNVNNLIQVIEAQGKYNFKKKTFRNDNITGYKIGIDISPDGKIIASGDSKGFGLFWDWKSGKLVKKLKISKKLVNIIKYHPQEQSRVIAGGLSGEIYYCD